MTCGSLCTREVDLVDPEETVLAAAYRMDRRQVGTLVVVDGHRKPVGILTDRDVVTRVLARGRVPDETRVGEVMTHPIKFVHEDTPIEWALSRMTTWGVRRLPVTDREDRLVGMLSLMDVLSLLSEEFALIGKLLAQGGRRPVLPEQVTLEAD